jgi:predicted RNA-binding Zn ribbon-like protein
MISDPDLLSKLHRMRRPRPWIASYGDPSVEFVNTRWARLTPAPRETLRHTTDLLDWLAMKQVVDVATFRRWSMRLRRSPRLAQRIFREAIEVREAIYAIYWALLERRRPRRRDFQRLNEALAAAVSYPALILASPRVFRVSQEIPDAATSALVAPIAVRAANLLVGDIRRLRRCSNKTCGLLFFDKTKTGRRRWCDMARCGARAKMREYRRRIGRARPSTGSARRTRGSNATARSPRRPA